MARIPAEELERLKAEISVERLVESSGVELKAAGKDLLGRCPFHEDREASLVVTPGKNLWHCFSCQIGGGPIDWMMKTKGVSFRHAVELLREGGALTAPRARGGRLLPAAVAFDAGDHALMVLAIVEGEGIKSASYHLAAFKRHGTQRVLIAYDRDEAGDRAAEKLAPQLIGAGLECYRIQFPKGMDANEYALKVQPAAKSLGIVIRKAVWLGKGTPASTSDVRSTNKATSLGNLFRQPNRPVRADPLNPDPTNVLR